MTLLSLLAAILIEQILPLSVRKYVEDPVEAFARFLEDRFGDGVARHGTVAWCIAVLPAVLACAVIYWLLYLVQPVAAWIFNALTLYLCMGYRQHSHFFGRIQTALRADDVERARSLLAEWRGGRYDRSPPSEIARLSIEHAFVIGHRQVFALFPLFFLFPGPSGVVLYRLAERFAKIWVPERGPGFAEFGRFARKAFDVIDWLPARISAVAFSIMGDFQDAVDCWRSQAAQWPNPIEGILIAAGAGAIGVILGNPVSIGGELVERPELGLGDEADVDFMYSAVGLIRRTLILFLLLILLITISGWAGV